MATPFWSDRVVELADRYAKKWGTTRARVLGDSRRHEDVRARWEVMHVLHREDGKSLSLIGRWLRRDHSTVLHGLRALEAERAAGLIQ